CTAPLRRPGGGRSAVREHRLRSARELESGRTPDRVSPVRPGRPRLRHVPERNHQHELVRCVRGLAAHGEHPRAPTLILEAPIADKVVTSPHWPEKANGVPYGVHSPAATRELALDYPLRT